MILARRFPTILGLLLLALCLAGGWFVFHRVTAISPGEVPARVRESNVADNKFTVSWVTSSPTSGAVQYGPVAGNLTTVVSDDRDTSSQPGDYLTHYVTVQGLQPNTQYAFRLLSGHSKNVFDNNGSPYAVTTGATIATLPPAKSFYGTLQSTTGKVDGVIVYLALPNAAVASTLVHSTGSYAVSISTMRTASLATYTTFDPVATIATVTFDSGAVQSNATVSLANAAPVPAITLGQNADFRAQAQTPAVAVVEPTTSSPIPQPADVFNLSPIGSTPPSPGTVTIVNPGTDGEDVSTTRPEFRGTGPSALTLSISVHSVNVYSDTVAVASDGTWSWSPPADLPDGTHTLTINYIDAKGVAQTLSRTFTVDKALATAGTPAFVASSSASTAPTTVVNPSPSSLADLSTTDTSSTSGRVGIPAASGSALPETGVLTPTILTAGIGSAIMVLGALLLAL